LPKGAIGAVRAIPSFGAYGRWHPYPPLIVAEGLFAGSGVFHGMPKFDVQPLAELFRAAVLKMLRKEGKFDEEPVGTNLRWRCNSGFSVNPGVQLGRYDADDQEAHARYILRNPFSVENINCRRSSGQVVYKSKINHGKPPSARTPEKRIPINTRHNTCKS